MNLPNFHVKGREKFYTFVDSRCRVQQGSILRPLLFLLIIDDMRHAADCKFFLYVDSKCLLHHQKNME